MNRINIKTMHLPDCTVGVLSLLDLRLFTLELPWIENEKNISCIPRGNYIGYIRNSPSNGWVIEFKDVPNRSHIQIHSGNFTHQIKGCILVGDSIKDINQDGVPDVTNSKNSLAKLLNKVDLNEEVQISIE